MQTPPPGGPPPGRRINPRMAIAIVAVAGAGVYLYIRHRNAAASSSSAPSTEAPPDNTYEQQSSATAEFGQEEGEISNLGQSVAAAQAAETTTAGNLATGEYLQTGFNTATDKQLKADESKLAQEAQQIAQLQREVATLKKPPPKKPPAKKVHAT